MLHIGIGETQLNNFLTAVNLPTISRQALKTREDEVGKSIQEVAKESVADALQKEINETKGDTNEPVRITGSVDGAWQSRGSGRSYNSLSGHASMIGVRTGKIIGYDTRIKTCRVCEHAKRQAMPVRDHVCHKNWDGSSKAMEADMVVSMVKDINDNNDDSKVGTMRYTYLTKVNENLGLSPGALTLDRAKLMDKNVKRHRERARTRKVKRRRLVLKSEKSKSVNACETREGDTYRTSITLSQGDTESIPPPIPCPEPTPVKVQKSDVVYFDLETTGLERTSHITQIAAVGPNGSFSRYVHPRIAISAKATAATGLTHTNNELFHNGKKVDAVTIQEALTDFIDFVGDKHVLVGHNVKVFDTHVLVNAARACNMLDKLEVVISGFADTYVMFKTLLPKEESYKQERLYSSIVGGSYAAHDAIEDVISLKRIVETAKEIDLERFSFSLDYVYSVQEFNKNKKDCLASWGEFLAKKVISKGMADKAAGSGLEFRHVKLVFDRKGRDGVDLLFGEKTMSGKPRVTKNKKIIDSVAAYMSEQ